MSDCNHIGFYVNTDEERVDVWIDGVLHEGASLSHPIRFSYEEGVLKLKVGVYLPKDENDS
jgi:hypothetical protein